MAGAFEHKRIEEEVRDKIATLHAIRVVRGEEIARQFGPSEHLPNDIERDVFETGQTRNRLIESDDGVHYQHVIPYFADKSCTQCHQVAEGTLLGVVDMELDLTRERDESMRMVYLLVGLFVLFSLLLIWAVRQMVLPVMQTTNRMREVVERAEQGDFTLRLDESRNDELGEVALHTNRLLDSLQQGFGNIVHFVGDNERQPPSAGNNLIAQTVDSVKSMVEAARFKQLIEADRSLVDVYERIRDLLQSQFALQRFTLYEVDATQQQMKPLVCEGLGKGEQERCAAEVLLDSQQCRVCRTAQDVHSLHEPLICPLFSQFRLDEAERQVHFCIPLLQGGRIGGVLQIVAERSEAGAVEERLRTIHTYLAEAAPVIESKRLNEMLHQTTLRDPMTGLYNRRFLSQSMSRLIAQADRRHSVLTLLMCDIDHFKHTNDTYGHQAGDLVLRDAAERMLHSVRQSDLVLRIGGEEFLIVLDDADSEKAMEVGERIRHSIEARDFQAGTIAIRKTMSLGMARFPEDGSDFEAVMAMADTALYEAKESGRNRLVRYRAEMVGKAANPDRKSDAG